MKYKDAGVDRAGLGSIKKRIKLLARKTFNARVLSEIGLFGGLFEIRGFKRPVLVASTDSVGTKIMIAAMAGKHRSIGMDIVNHCINDILTLGARPLFFLDYIAYTRLEPEVIGEVVEGMAQACRQEGVALIGGETAQLPGFYPDGIYDLVGFIVGVIEKGDVIDGRRIRPGNLIVGFRSNGLHTNGYSLARAVLFKNKRYSISTYLPGLKNSLGTELLKPHISYHKKLRPHLRSINGLAHITGGGFYENIERILPEGCRACIVKSSWQIPPIFNKIQEIGNIPEEEMYNVFNMGIGMVAFVDRMVSKRLSEIGGIEIGFVEKGHKEVVLLER